MKEKYLLQITWLKVGSRKILVCLKLIAPMLTCYSSRSNKRAVGINVVGKMNNRVGAFTYFYKVGLAISEDAK